MNAALEATIARDRQVSAVWRRVADGEISFDAAETLTTSHVVGARDQFSRNLRLSQPNPKPVAKRYLHDTQRSTRPPAERARRLADRKRLAVDAFPSDPAWADFTTTERAVAKVIGRACRMRKGCTMAVATIAERAFCSVRAVQAATRKLEAAGVIVCLARRLKGHRSNETNQIIVKSQAWLEYLRKRAALARIDRVQKSAGEQNSTCSVNLTEVGGKKTRPWFATTAKSENWLARFRVLAGPCLNPGAGLLSDPGPLTRLMARQACSQDDVLKGVRDVRRRHERSGRSGAVWSWEYFAPAIEAARDHRAYGVAA